MITTLVAATAIAMSAPSAESVVAEWAKAHSNDGSLEIIWISSGAQVLREDRTAAIEYKMERCVLEWPKAILVENRQLVKGGETPEVPPPRVSDFSAASRVWFVSRDFRGNVRTCGLSSSSVDSYETSKSFQDEAMQGSARTPWIVARFVLDQLSAKKPISVKPVSDTAIEVSVTPVTEVRLVNKEGHWRCEQIRQVGPDNEIVFLADFADFVKVDGLDAEQPMSRTVTRPDPTSLLARTKDPKAPLRLGAPVTDTVELVRIRASIRDEEMSLESPDVAEGIRSATENARQLRREQAARKAARDESAAPR